jgi:hypothetical protein
MLGMPVMRGSMRTASLRARARGNPALRAEALSLRGQTTPEDERIPTFDLAADDVSVQS